MKLHAIFVIVTLAAGCSHDDAAQQSAGTPIGKSWSEYSDAEGGFRVLLPGELEHSTHDMPTPFGGTMKFHNVMVHMHKNTQLFYVTYVDYPIQLKPEDEAGAYEIMGSYVTGGAKKKNLQLERKSKIRIGDYPGEEYLFTDPEYNDKSLWRVYFVGNRLYQLISNWAPKSGQSSKDAEKFLNSFRLNTDSNG